MGTLEIRNLYKHYDSFDLKDVSFEVKPGKITGFIGRNGAGKTTTLKSIYNLIKPTSGEILYEGKPILEDEMKYKQDVAMLIGEMNYYPTKTVKDLTNVTKTFYPDWNEGLYHQFLKEFNIDEKKQIKALSTGMKVKYGLALALSRGAKILLLDEPTSGLDPVSRDELLDIFINLVSDKEHAILFSTHVISDLEKCADEIIYIRNGQIIASQDVTSFEGAYLHYQGESSILEPYKERFLFYHDRLGKFEGILPVEDKIELENNQVEVRKATLEEIMVAFERGKGE